MNQDIKLVIDQLDRVELQYLCDTDTVQTTINMLEVLGDKVAEQSTVIEKQRASILNYHHYLMKNSGYKDSVGYKTSEALLAIPTDSKQILADWMREQLGDPVGVFANVNALTPENGERWEHMVDDAHDGEDYIHLYKLPDILK